MLKFYHCTFIFLFIILTAYSQSKFQAILPEKSGINFQNKLPETAQNNIITYEYFYNGGGVAAGDFNNDGWIDLFFTSNLGDNKLYLNKGDFTFEDISKKAGITGKKGWTTGVSLVDINHDGYLDIYVCYSGDVEPKNRKNQLFINNQNLTFTEKAAEYGIDDTGHTTMAAFFDMDQDGDLDLYVLNHNVKQYRNFDAAFVKNMVDPDAGDRLYENINGKYVDITQKAGIKSNPLGYGLGINIADLNNDGWPDIYICNDYVEEDYMYINNQNGTFSEVLKERLPNISNFSMGVDVADINNDGWMDIFTLDMLPEDNRRQKLLYAPDNFELYNNMVENGFHHQLMRNMLHLNNGNNTFSEIGQLAGISNTDWSWAALFADFNNSGYKDLFVTNGYGRDMINRDFMKFYANERLKHLQGKTDEKMFSMLQSIESTPLRNYIFENKNGLEFINRSDEWGFTESDFAHGAIYADLDNDGDLDIIFNRMNEMAGVYKNMTMEQNSNRHYIQIELKSNTKNNFAVGSRIIVYTPESQQTFENHFVHGFQSSIVGPLHVGLPSPNIDSIRVNWPDGTYQVIAGYINSNQKLKITQGDEALSTVEATTIVQTLFSTPHDTFPYYHKELMVNDFKVQPLMPNMVSYHGPKMAQGDINGDGLEDIYFCSPEGQAGMLFLQMPNGIFVPSHQPMFNMDQNHEDTHAVFFDADGDGDMDLYVVSGGYGARDAGLNLQDRLYINNGGLFFPDNSRLPKIDFSGSVVVPWDFDGDGDIDLFVGGRVAQGAYPLSPGSILLINDGKGNFSNYTKTSIFENLGMVTDAKTGDLNGDGQEELIICGEWMPITVLKSIDGLVSDVSPQYMDKQYHGWWNTLHIEDIDQDGDLDIIAGNWGLNSQIKAPPSEPVELYYADFDDNGYIDPIMCYYIQGVSYPMASRDEITDQIVSLRPYFVTYDSYADKTIFDIFPQDKVKNSPKLQADIFETVWFENVNEKLEIRSFPVQTNFSPIHAVLVDDFDGDGIKDILLAGNVEQARIRIGKNVSNYGCLLKGDGNGQFTYIPQIKSGLAIQGCVRSLISIKDSENKKNIIAGMNNSKSIILKLNSRR